MKKPFTILMTMALVFTLVACSVSTPEATAISSVVEQPSSGDTSATVVTSESAGTNPAAQVVNSDINEAADDYVWDSAAVIPITLSGNSISVTNEGVMVDGSTATITAAGTYRLTGALSDGQIIVDTADKAIVRLILNGVDIHNSNSAPIYIADADKTILILAENTQNTISDGETYVFASADVDEPNAAIFSTADLTIYGSGSLTVNGNYNDGIASKDGLILASGAVTVNAVDDGIRGKDYVVVKNGSYTIDAGGDGLKADNAEDATLGFIVIEGGILNITANGDAIAAQTTAMISAGELTLTTNGETDATTGAALSAKGIKGVTGVVINDGNFSIDAVDDAVHSNGDITINGGQFAINSYDDGMHADSTLTINGGEITINSSYEGLESAVITINSGTIQIVSSDDGINVAGGMDGSGIGGPGGGRQRTGGLPGELPGGLPGGMQGQETFNYTGDYYLYINGGTILVDADGDGLDVNGAIEMKGGLVLVNGPTEQMNGALDYDGGFNITGGYLVAVGSSGMAMAPDESSSQNSLLVNFTSTLQEGTLVHIQDKNGAEIMTFTAAKPIQSLAFSSSGLVNGASYDIFTGGGSTGAEIDGLFQDGAYSGGSQYESFTVSSVVTRIGTATRTRP